MDAIKKWNNRSTGWWQALRLTRVHHPILGYGRLLAAA